VKKKMEKKERRKRLPQEDYGVTGINNYLLVFHPDIGDVESQFFIFIFFVNEKNKNENEKNHPDGDVESQFARFQISQTQNPLNLADLELFIFLGIYTMLFIHTIYIVHE